MRRREPDVRMRLPLAPRKASLCEALDRLLDTGAVVVGELRIKVAEVDLLYVALELVACSWETALDHGVTRMDERSFEEFVGEEA